jgi:hypothetical protein
MAQSLETKEILAKVSAVDQTLGLVMGFAIVCKQGGEEYFDLQGDHIPEDAMLEATTEFMLNSRTAKAMHAGEAAGSIVFAWPMTTEIAKAFGIEVNTTGLMIAMKPDEEMMKKFVSGEYTGFSIGGRRIKDKDAAK